MERRAAIRGSIGADTAKSPRVGFGPETNRLSEMGRLADDGRSELATVIAAMNESVPPLRVVTRNLTKEVVPIAPNGGSPSRVLAPSDQPIQSVMKLGVR
jgi:hypothetical protein